MLDTLLCILDIASYLQGVALAEQTFEDGQQNAVANATYSNQQTNNIKVNSTSRTRDGYTGGFYVFFILYCLYCIYIYIYFYLYVFSILNMYKYIYFCMYFCIHYLYLFLYFHIQYLYFHIQDLYLFPFFNFYMFFISIFISFKIYLCLL